jgi:hypothetical protein
MTKISREPTIRALAEYAVFQTAEAEADVHQKIDEFIKTGGNVRTFEQALDWAQNHGYVPKFGLK